jgi:DNA-binding response OmpR family regulator
MHIAPHVDEPTPEKQPRLVEEGRSRILVVEDDAAFGDIIERTLHARGYEVFRAGSVPEGREVLHAAGPVDLVLSDVRLPRGAGIDLLYAEELAEANTPLLVMTAFPSDDLRGFLEAMGVPLLEKPFSMEKLVSQVLAMVLLHSTSPAADWTGGFGVVS